LILGAGGMRGIETGIPHLELWLADADAWPDEADEGLSDDERERAARFVFERDRRRYRVAHRFLRRLLARYAPAAATLPFRIGPHGRPSLATPDALDFNMSHSDRWVLVGMGRDVQWGVDVEAVRAMDDLDALAAQNFTPAEQDELASVAPANRLRAFLSGWTRKEACLKALGTGLTVPADRVDAGLGPQPRRVAVRLSAGTALAEVHSLQLGEDMLAAVARLIDATSVELR